jgi:hypothetical protein
MMVFHYGYNAAFLLERHFACTKQDHKDLELMGGHAFAMMLSTPPKGPYPKVFAHLHGESNIIDFQNEPNPSEVMKAKGPLERLMARATQLLTAFPGHSILLGIGRVCDKVCKFDIMTTSIGKMGTARQRPSPTGSTAAGDWKACCGMEEARTRKLAPTHPGKKTPLRKKGSEALDSSCRCSEEFLDQSRNQC